MVRAGDWEVQQTILGLKTRSQVASVAVVGDLVLKSEGTLGLIVATANSRTLNKYRECLKGGKADKNARRNAVLSVLSSTTALELLTADHLDVYMLPYGWRLSAYQLGRTEPGLTQAELVKFEEHAAEVRLYKGEFKPPLRALLADARQKRWILVQSAKALAVHSPRVLLQ